MNTSIRHQNQTAADRREAVIDAAIAEFSRKGLHGTATEDIARRVGISQPYIFRLFGTKKDLFLAACDRHFIRLMHAMEGAATSARGDGTPILQAMAAAYNALIADRVELGMLLQCFTASDDPQVRQQVRGRYLQLFEYVRDAAGVSREEAADFFAHGMLLMVLAAIDLPVVLGYADWDSFTRECLIGSSPKFGMMLAAPQP